MKGAEMLGLIQEIAKNTVNSGSPSDYCIGKVASVSPLQIELESHEVLGEEFLVLTDLVRDFNVDITVSHVTEKRGGGSGLPAYESHDHDYKGRKKITVHNALHVGESVLLIRQAGGQEFIVLSRIFDHTNLTGQWL